MNLLARIHQRRELVDHLTVPDADSSNLDDAVEVHIKPGCLHIDHDEVNPSDIGPTVAGQHGLSHPALHWGA